MSNVTFIFLMYFFVPLGKADKGDLLYSRVL